MHRRSTRDHLFSFLTSMAFLFLCMTGVTTPAYAQDDDIGDSGFDDFDAEDAIEGESFDYQSPDAPSIEGALDTNVGGFRRVERHYSELSTQLPRGAYTAVAIDPGDAEVMFVGGDGAVFKSDDGGESWRPVLTFARGPSAVGIELLSAAANRAADDATDNAAAADDAEPEEELPDEESDEEEFDEFGGDVDADVDTADPAADVDVLQDLPDGELDTNVRIFSRQLEGVRRIVFLDDKGKNIIVATPVGLFRSRDGGESFVFLDRGSVAKNDVRDIAVDPNNTERVFIASADGTFRANLLAGNKFERVTASIAKIPSLSIVAEDEQGQTVIVVGTEFGAMRSNNGGKTFRELLLRGVTAEAVGVVAYDSRTRITYAGTHKGLFAGERGDAILELRRVFRGATILSIAVDPLRKRGVAVGVLGKGVFESENSGIDVFGSESALKTVTPNDIARPPNDSDALTIATGTGLFQNVKGEGLSVTRDKVRTFVKTTRKEPTVVETMNRALRYSRLRTVALDSMKTRLRWAALIPRVVARADFRRRDEIVTSDDILVEVGFDIDEDLDPDNITVSDAFTSQERLETWMQFLVIAQWDTDQVLFRVEEIVQNRRTEQFVKTEARVAQRVSTLFEARRRIQAALFFEQNDSDPLDRARLEMRMAEFTALLDASTGGWFTREARARGAPLDELLEFER